MRITRKQTTINTIVCLLLPFSQSVNVANMVLGRIAQIAVSAYVDKAAFSDVSEDAYYAPYAAWAAEADITYGVGEGNFAPDILINRAQMAALIVGYMDLSGIALTAETVVTVPADFDDIPEYAREPVLRLWRFGFFKGDSAFFLKVYGVVHLSADKSHNF